MIAVMAKKKSVSKHGRRAPGTKDVFARLQQKSVDELDVIAKAMSPRTTRSGLIAHVLEQYLIARRGTQGGGEKER